MKNKRPAFRQGQPERADLSYLRFHPEDRADSPSMEVYVKALAFMAVCVGIAKIIAAWRFPPQ